MQSLKWGEKEKVGVILVHFELGHKLYYITLFGEFLGLGMI